jgi:hypothetical protein
VAYRQRIFFVEMSEATCSACGSALIPGAGFCRQCAAVMPAVTGYREAEAGPTARELPAPTGRLKVVIAALIIAGLFGLGSVVRSLIKSRPSLRAGAPVSRALIYPGARVVLDVASQDGGSVLQLKSADPLDKVQNWYIANLHPTKILQVTLGTLILRKDTVTATIASENNTTNILIKQSQP